MAWHRASGLAPLVIALVCSGRASAQTPVTLDDLRGLIEAQRALIDRQTARLDDQARELSDLRNAVARLAPSPGVVPPAVIEPAVAVADDQTQRHPEMPEAVVSAGDFPGSIRVPGTNTAIKFGGQARMTLVHTLQPLGVEDRFITSSIPVGVPAAGEAARTVYTPIASRVNLDMRSPSGVGDVRAFLEWDFADTKNAARLRHAYIQAGRWTIGQTWSTFSDPEADPIGIDFEGLNAISRLRQPQVRFTQPMRDHLSVSVAVENPAPDLTGASGVNLTPDFVARLRWERPDTAPGPHLLGRSAHVQAAVIARTLRGELTTAPDETLSTQGFGANVSGVLVPQWAATDRIKFAANSGWGIGRYITDLGALGGQDAFYDATTASLRALPAFSSYAGYERAWRPKFSSTLTYGLVRVNNLDAQPSDSLHETQRGSLNLMWTPVPRFEFVLEFLGGRRVNKDGTKAASSQIQAGWTFVF